MWTPADNTALPTPEDLVHAKEAIINIENLHRDAVAQLANAMMEKCVLQDGTLIGSVQPHSSDNQSTLCPPQKNIIVDETNPEVPISVHRQVEILWRDLQARRSWIAPVRMLCYDILSLIFEYCGEDDWKTTLQIAAVSRGWRNAVLATPRAWAFLDLKDGPREHTVQMYLHRSSQRPLHLYLPNSMSLVSLSHVFQRIRCLNVPSSALGIDRPYFPNIERLVVRGPSGTVQLSSLSTDYFPVLRSLVCDVDIVKPTVPSSEAILPVMAPLFALSLVANGHSMWLDLLRGCQDSIVSLKVDLRESLRTSSILLPKLESLEIQYYGHNLAIEHLKLITPILKTYAERSEYVDSPSLLHLDLRAVQQMRVDQVPTLSATPTLKLLELERMQHVYDVIRQLLSDPSCCPDMEIIRWIPEDDGMGLSASDISRAYLVHRVAKLNQRRDKPILLSVATSETREDGLIGMIKASACGNNMPCSEYA